MALTSLTANELIRATLVRQLLLPISKRWQKHGTPWHRIVPTTIRGSAQLAWLAGTIGISTAIRRSRTFEW